MGKFLKKISVAVFAMLLIFAAPAMKLYAANASIAVSSATAANGEEVSVTVSIKSDEEVGIADLWLTYDASVLEYVSGADVGGGGSIHFLNDKSSYTIKFKTIAAGTAAISVDTARSSVGSLTTDSLLLSASNGSVTVKAPANYSSNNDLSALSISPGTLSPAFSKNVTTYNTEVPADCKRLVVSATTADSKAKISIWGAALDPGDNTTKITVTAENGATKVYTIYTKRPFEDTIQKPTQGTGETPTEKKEDVPKTDVLVNVDGQDYFILSNFDESALPEGYEAVEYSYKGTDVIVGKGLSNGLIVFYLETATDSASEKKFFIYDEAADQFLKLQRLNSVAREYTILKEGMTELPNQYVETKLEFAGEQIDVWIENDANPKYFLFYGMSIAGNKGWYRYDLVENTIQNAFVTATENVVEQPTESVNNTPVAGEISADYQKLKNEYDNYAAKMKLVLCVLAIALLVVIILFIVFVVRSFTTAGNDKYKRELPEYENDDNDEENENENDEYEELVVKANSDEEDEFDEDLPDLDNIDISEDFSFNETEK